MTSGDGDDLGGWEGLTLRTRHGAVEVPSRAAVTLPEEAEGTQTPRAAMLPELWQATVACVAPLTQVRNQVANSSSTTAAAFLEDRIEDLALSLGNIVTELMWQPARVSSAIDAGQAKQHRMQARYEEAFDTSARRIMDLTAQIQAAVEEIVSVFALLEARDELAAEHERLFGRVQIDLAVAEAALSRAQERVAALAAEAADFSDVLAAPAGQVD